MSQAILKARDFIRACSTGRSGEFTFCPGGQVSLYASCYAAMALHYLGELSEVPQSEQREWRTFINSWQDPETGYFIGPELEQSEFTRKDNDLTYARLHLAVHALPALDLLEGTPQYPISFAREFTEPTYLREWLLARDWGDAWLEGNNLLFAGQLLVHLRDHESDESAQAALDLYFDWLDDQQDSNTGLWGTNGYCDNYVALYGGYHQLLIYHFCGRPVNYAERIIDTTLSLQQADGSFSRSPGGGACEDADAVNVLVDLVKRTGYRVSDVQSALRRTLPHILRQQHPNGGFVYRWGKSYMQSGLLRTFTPANSPDLFSTWFRLNTLALINEVIFDSSLQDIEWAFNSTCSMGWHASRLQGIDDEVRMESDEASPAMVRRTRLNHSVRSVVGPTARKMLGEIPTNLMLKVFQAIIPRYTRELEPQEALGFLAGIDRKTNELGEEAAFEFGHGLHARFWWSQSYRFFIRNVGSASRILHLGCGSGSLSYSLATQSRAEVFATARSNSAVDKARVSYHHPRLEFVSFNPNALRMPEIDLIIFTDFEQGAPAWSWWKDQWIQFPQRKVLAQLTTPPGRWQEGHSIFGNGSRHHDDLPTIGSGGFPTEWQLIKVEREAGTLFAELKLPSAAGSEPIDVVEANQPKTGAVSS